MPLRQQNGEMGEVGSQAIQSRREEEVFEYGWSMVAHAALHSLLMHAHPVSVLRVAQRGVAPVSVGLGP